MVLASPSRFRGRAYTLMELLVVLLILSVLASIGIAGFRALARKGELDATQQLVRSLLRRARNTAREERFPAVVELDFEANEVRAVTRETLAFFRFEDAPIAADPFAEEDASDDVEDPAAPDIELPRGAREATITGALDIEATVVNADSVVGYLGQGLLFGESAGSSTGKILGVSPAWVQVEERPSLSPVEGIFVEAWVQPGRLDRKLRRDRDDGYDGLLPDYDEKEKPVREAAPRSVMIRRAGLPGFTIVRKGRAYELSLNADYSLEVALTGPNADGDLVSYVGRTRPGTLVAERWARVAMAFDGIRAQLYVNGMERTLVALSEELARLPTRLIQAADPLTFSDPNPRRTFYGVLDEIRIAGLIRGTTIKVPLNIVIVPERPTVKFDGLGQLDPLSHASPVSILLSDAPDIQERILPDRKQETQLRSVERGSVQERKALDEAGRFQDFLRRARRELRKVDGKHRREIIVDMHGTLR